MLRLVLILIAAYSFVADASECDTYNTLSALQKNRLEFAYHQGVDDNLGWTLASIALTESAAGVYRLNVETKDLGLFQVNAKTLYRTLGITNYYKRIEIVQKVIHNDILGSYVALSVLKYFRAYHKGDWRKMVASYNAGFNTKAGAGYSEKVVANIKMLKKCMKTS